MSRGRARALLAAVAFAAACFAIGLWAGRASGPGRTADDAVIEDAAPRIVFDPATIRLLPDASLHLAPIEGFDAGAGDASGP